MKSKYKKLFSNSLLFTIGNLGSKFITFIMLPLYTYKLNVNEFGITDLVQTTAGLLVPIVYLCIYDAVLRFSMEEEENAKQILSIAFFVASITSSIVFIGALILSFFKINYAMYVGLIIILQGFQIIFSQFCKAIGKIQKFAINGILLTLLTAIFNIVFLVIFNWGVSGFFISIILANFLSIIYLVKSIQFFGNIDFNLLNKQKLSELLSFSIPLIPNSIAWWVTNTASRYFILFFLGTSANGIFAIANKIPSLLTLINSVFYQSWQLSSVEEYKSSTKDKFYTDVFNAYSAVLFVSTMSILFFIKPILNILVTKSFYSAWRYVPFLMLTVVYSSLSSFLGQNYIVAKNTNKIFSTTILGAIINVVFNLILIPIIGLDGAGISSSLSFLFVMMYRLFDSKKIINIEINKSQFIGNNIIILIQIGALYSIKGYSVYIVQIVLIIFIIVINRSTIRIAIKMFAKKNNA